jgi:hypothetical protein
VVMDFLFTTESTEEYTQRTRRIGYPFKMEYRWVSFR